MLKFDIKIQRLFTQHREGKISLEELENKILDVMYKLRSNTVLHIIELITQMHKNENPTDENMSG